jgi:hypothetical protein
MSMKLVCAKRLRASPRGGCWPGPAGGRIAGRAAEELLSSRIGEDTLKWRRTNFFKTELELGHYLRAPAERPCECAPYLRCSKFLTTSEYAPRLRSRLACEQQVAQDVVERGWLREVERHTAIANRIRPFSPTSAKRVRVRTADRDKELQRSRSAR